MNDKRPKLVAELTEGWSQKCNTGQLANHSVVPELSQLVTVKDTPVTQRSVANTSKCGRICHDINTNLLPKSVGREG